MKKIPSELVKALIEYLATRPYNEVAGAVDALSKLEDIDTKQKDK